MTKTKAAIGLVIVALIPLSVVGSPPSGTKAVQPTYLLRYSVFKVDGLGANEVRKPALGGATFMIRVPDLMGSKPCGDGPSMKDEAHGVEYRYSCKLHGDAFPLKADVFYSFKSTMGFEKESGVDSEFQIEKKGIELESPDSVRLITSWDGKYAMFITLIPHLWKGELGRP